MKSIIKNSASILIVALLGLLLITPAVAIADRDHHRHDHRSYGGDHYYDRHDHGYNNHRHYKRHKRHKNHRHYRNYGQPRGYYNRQPRYQPRYNAVYNQYTQQVYNNYYPSQPYGYRPNVSLGIHAGNTSFMLRY